MFVGNQDELDRLDPIFEQIILLFVALFRWFASVFKRPTLDVSTPAAVERKETYAEKRKRVFLGTFEDADTNLWNANIDEELNDTTAMSEILNDANNELEKKWKRSVLIDCTPRGNVFMFYDVYKQSFSYYCDQAVMPYELLNAVAMKYVMSFRCRNFFVDSAILPKPTESDAQPLELKPKQAKTDSQTHFAKFKSYNTSTKKVIVSKEDDKIINKFLYLGPIRNWSPITKRAKLNPLNGFQTDMISNAPKLSYQEYKNLQLGNSRAKNELRN
jgi:hypothetical protein